MLDGILSFLNGVIGFLASVLPESPFSSVLDSTTELSETVHMALGWLNWFVPVGDMLGIFVAYLGVLLLIVAIDFFVGGFLDGVKGAIGGGAA